MLTFTRVPTSQINELMEEPELIQPLMADMGFSLDDHPNDQDILNVLERRWQGEEQNYSLEHYAEAAKLMLLDHLSIDSISLLFNGGKESNTKINGKAVHVLSPLEVHKISNELAQINIAELQYEWLNIEKLGGSLPAATAEEVDTCWSVFPGVFRFFQLASDTNECVIRASI